MDSDSEKHGQNSERDAKTGRFLPGNRGGLPVVSGRKKAEFDFQALMDERIPRDRWGEMLDKQVEKALAGDTPAFKLLVERRFGEAVDPNEKDATDRFFAFLAAVRGGLKA